MFALAFGVLALAMPASVWAQGATSNITGRATDSSGGALPGVTVSVTSPNLIGGARTTVTDEEGVYRFTQLPGGAYTVKFELAGFTTLNIEGVNVSGGSTMTINGIPLGVSLDGAKAPQAVSSTVYLTQKKFYDGLSCHRLTNGGFYVLQCGDPQGTGNGGPGYEYGPIENAPSDDKYPAGTIAMARQGNNAESQGSQFFIVYKDTTIGHDDAGGYTVIGKVTSGLDTLVKQVADKGVKGGGTDGTPAVATKIDAFTLQ